MFNFDWPWLFFFAPLPLAIYVLIPRAREEEAALRVPFFHRAESALVENNGFTRSRSLLMFLSALVVWLLLLTAAARPQWIGDAVSLPASGRDLLVAVDISGSMSTEDMVVEEHQIPRILIVKYVVGDFLNRRINDRLGLILFGSNAYLQSPLTFDRKTVNQLLQEAQLGFAGRQTAIGDAIGLAIKRLKDRSDSHRVVILLTDGANTAGQVDPRQAAELARQAGVKIYTVGVGAERMVKHVGPFARTVNPSQDLDENTLQYIADATGGKYFRARNPQELELIYQTLDQLEPVEQDAEIFRPIKALFYWPLGSGLIVSLLMGIFAVASQIRSLGSES